ncbi:lactate utilization protein C [Helicobacter cinaedi]|uniref:LutC/YkgG family protein n=1 Tax=Helicobacter cinaedi TaxID=213 RepID=UPI001F3C6A6E|nr:lactate utilization protein C [Helicobacter cinaedi]BDB63759.1 lactate utilization protein C [Helicobacter cinaedi]
MSRQSILNNVKASLQENKIQAQFPNYANPMKRTNDDKVQEYIAWQGANKAIVIESSQESLAQDIYKALAESQAKNVLYNPNIDINPQSLKALDTQDSMQFVAYEKSVDEQRANLFAFDTSIVQASCGVANLGVIGVASSVKAPRLSSLITRTCIALLKKQDVVENFYEGVQTLKAQGENGKLPTNMIFIAGPSRTADIELQTVFGVHGSVKSYIILY